MRPVSLLGRAGRCLPAAVGQTGLLRRAGGDVEGIDRRGNLRRLLGFLQRLVARLARLGYAVIAVLHPMRAAEACGGDARVAVEVPPVQAVRALRRGGDRKSGVEGKSG